jgi:hypothetical protein
LQKVDTECCEEFRFFRSCNPSHSWSTAWANSWFSKSFNSDPVFPLSKQKWKTERPGNETVTVAILNDAYQ